MLSAFTSLQPRSTPLGGRSFWQRHGGAPADNAGATAPEQLLPQCADFVIVGGGLAGLATALALVDMEPQAQIVLLEARFLGFGASGRNAGLISPLPAPLWLASADRNPDHLWGLGYLYRRAEEIAGWLKSEASEARVEPKTLRLEAQGTLTATGLARVAEVIRKAGIGARAAAGPDGHLAIDVDTHALDPYRTVLALAAIARWKGVMIHEHAPVRGVEDDARGVNVALVSGRQISARAAIVCTNAYSGSLKLPGEKPAAKVVHNFMVATQAVPEEQLARPGAAQRFVVELNTAYVYYRIENGRAIFGGIERFKPWGTSDFDMPPDVLAGIERLLARSFPSANLKPAEAWGGVYHQTATDLPVIRRIGGSGAIVLNVGYGGTGVAMTLACGRIAAELARGKAPVDADDARLLATLTSTRIPVAALARFVATVGADVLLWRRPIVPAKGSD